MTAKEQGISDRLAHERWWSWPHRHNEERIALRWAPGKWSIPRLLWFGCGRLRYSATPWGAYEAGWQWIG